MQALQLCFSRETLNVVENIGLSTAEKNDQVQIIAALRRYIDGQVNETIERRNLRLRTQQAGESFDDFLVSLRELAKTCNFCNNDCLQRALRDQIIEGLQDGEIIQELLQVKDLTLDQTISRCRGLEAAKQSRKHIQGTPEVNIVRSRRYMSNTGPCAGCGGDPHDGGRKKCPAYNQVCRSCGKMGHFSRVRRQKPAGTVNQRGATHQANALSTSDLPLLRLSNLGKGSITHAPTITMHVTTCNGQTNIDILPDSGADICVAGTQFVKALGEHMDNLAHSDVVPRAVNGATIHPVGKIPNVMFHTHGKTVTENVHIYDSVARALISWATAKRLGILPECYPDPVVSVQACSAIMLPIPTTDQIMSEIPSVFDGQIRTMPGETFHISLTDDVRPFCVTTPRTIPFAYQDKLKQEIDLLVDQGIITPVTEPTEWCAPIVVAPKKNSDRIRMCVDLSKLNRFVRRECYPSITPAEAVADIEQSKANYFTMFDALKGYHQCPLDKESPKLTTFITSFGRFKYLRVPYGICSISEHYNRRMDEAFEGMQDFIRVVDDVVAFDRDQFQHIEHVRQLLCRCEKKHISLNGDKFKFCLTEVQFAGFKLTSTGYSVSPEITEAIANFPTPSSRTDLRSFCGLVNQLASSTKDIATALAPLRPLLSSRDEFLWTSVHEEASCRPRNCLQRLQLLPTSMQTKKHACTPMLADMELDLSSYRSPLAVTLPGTLYKQVPGSSPTW